MDSINFNTISADNFANVMGVSKATLEKWEANGTFVPHKDKHGKKYFFIKELMHVPEIAAMVNSSWDTEMHVQPARAFQSIELFAGAGGLALGMEKAGFKHAMLNEFDYFACETLRLNRPEWNIVEGDVHKIDFREWNGRVDFVSGGFPCQAFSYAGKGAGFEDTRGTLFFQLARAVKEIQPKVFLGENVRGLAVHDNGRTLQVIRNTIKELGYTLVEPRVLKAIGYQVPQKRERLFLIAIRNDYAEKAVFKWPDPYKRVMTLRDAFFAGELYPTDVPESPHQKYPARKQKIMEMIPEGGDWRDLPEIIQKEYMGASFYLGGGKTGMARRLSMDEPSLTLTCAPAQKQTERCHPTETRPLSVREYARIQTFPDDWEFAGTLSAQYKQIGNAVPVNLAWAVGRSVMRLMNQIEEIDQKGFSAVERNVEQNDFDSHKVTYIHTEKEFTQLSLFEPKTIYQSTAFGFVLSMACNQEELQWIQLHRFYIYPVKRPLSSIHKKLISINHIALIGNKTGTICFEVNGGKFATKKQVDLLDYPFSNITADAKTQYIVYELGKLENLANTACRPVVFLDQQAPLHIKQSNFSKRTRANHVGKRIDD
mgnify:FL=1